MPKISEETTLTPKQKAQAAIEVLGLTMEAKFVPFSQSRNKAEKHKSLNWIITIKRNGRDVLTTDYGAGCGHCPAKASKAPATYRAKDRFRADGKPYPGTTSNYRRPTEAERLADFLDEWRAAECESGIAMEYSSLTGEGSFKPRRIKGPVEFQKSTIPILPDIVDVIYSLSMDASVLDHASYESFASDFGYDADSRKGEAVYRACLEIALKLRAAIGEAGLTQLAEAFQDY